MPNAPVETKVLTAAATGSLTASTSLVVVYLLGTVPWIAAWPDTVQGSLAAVVMAGMTYGATWFAGWQTKHTPRTVTNEPTSPIPTSWLDKE